IVARPMNLPAKKLRGFCKTSAPAVCAKSHRFWISIWASVFSGGIFTSKSSTPQLNSTMNHDLQTAKPFLPDQNGSVAPEGIAAGRLGASCSPSPRPSPLGRGRTRFSGECNLPATGEHVQRRIRNPLSPRERAGVRGNKTPYHPHVRGLSQLVSRRN